MRWFGLFVLFLILSIIGVTMYRRGSSISPFTNQPIPSLGQEKMEVIPTIDVSDLKAGGSSYSEENGTYAFLYPSDFVLDTNDKQHIRIYKKGPTQKGQTEMYDGVLLVFEVISLEGKTLHDWVDIHIKNSTADGTSEVTQRKNEMVLNTYSGFTYTLRGLGESKNYILQKDKNSPFAVLISTSVNDPNTVGFQNDVDRILQTIELFK